MEKTQILEFITNQLIFTKQNDLDEIAKFQAQIAEGKSIRQAMEWGQEVVMHEIRSGFIARIERAIGNEIGRASCRERVSSPV